MHLKTQAWMNWLDKNTQTDLFTKLEKKPFFKSVQICIVSKNKSKNIIQKEIQLFLVDDKNVIWSFQIQIS